MTLDYQDKPAYQDKEERRLIILASLEILVSFFDSDRQEKYNAMKFYASFLGGGLTLFIAASKFAEKLDLVIISYLIITIIVAINFLATKKLISVRIATTNIYHEHGRRLRYLIDCYDNDLDEDGKQQFQNSFQKYIDEQIDGEVLKKGSADKFEVMTFLFINMIFSLMYVIPIKKFLVLYNVYDFHVLSFLTGFHVLLTFIFCVCLVLGVNKSNDTSHKL